MAMTRKERQDFKDALERKGEEAVREAYARGEFGEWEAPLAERRLWAERYLEPFNVARASGGEAKWIAQKATTWSKWAVVISLIALAIAVLT